MANYFNNYGQVQRQGGEILAVPVQGEIGAQNYLVAAGNTVLLTDFNSGLLTAYFQVCERSRLKKLRHSQRQTAIL